MYLTQLIINKQTMFGYLGITKIATKKIMRMFIEDEDDDDDFDDDNHVNINNGSDYVWDNDGGNDFNDNYDN